MISRLGVVLKKDFGDVYSAPRDIQLLALLVFLVAVHSMILGIFIFFFTELFYRFFFHAQMENLFFVRQSGLFLFSVGVFNLCPLFDLKGRHRLVIVIILIKILAVLFLVTHSSYAAWPPIILLAAAGDGIMALLLLIFYRNAWTSLEKSAAEAAITGGTYD